MADNDELNPLFDADKASFLCHLRSLVSAQSCISRVSINHCQLSQRLGSSICNGCESGSESQCGQMLARLSPGAHAQRSRETPTSCDHCPGTSSKANVLPPNLHGEENASLLCIKLCYTGRRLGIGGLIILIWNSKILCCALCWEHMMDLHVLNNLLQICAQTDTGYKVLCRLSQK